MADTNTQQAVSKDQEMMILQYATKAHTLLLNQFSMRQNLEEIDRYYMREGDFTDENIRNRIASRAGNKKKIQDITVPIIMPQVRAALSYMANVFLTGYPIFGVSSDPDQEDAALQMATIIAENAITAGWHRQLMLFFHDGLKYNLHGIECSWEQKKVAEITNDATASNGARVLNNKGDKSGDKKDVTPLWAGNVLRRMDLYNSFFDPRVHPAEIHSAGEYAGYIEMYSRVRMKAFINDLFGKVSANNAVRAFESSPSNTDMGSSLGTPFSYYQPLINPYPLMSRQNQQTFDWLAWMEGSLPRGRSYIRYTNVYEVMTLYARIIPDDFSFNVPAKNTPQVWKFIIINGTVVLYAERQSNAHNYIPIFYGQPLEDGLDFQTKSFAQNVTDMQDVASAMWNGYLASKRRLVGDRVLYDPMRVKKSDIDSTNPAAKIPVRPSAYGKPVNEAVYQFPFRDEQTQTMLQGAEQVNRFADKVNGVNPAQQGQFTKGNRTKSEYDDIMGRSDGGNQLMAMMTEGQVLSPMKEVIKLNILQYQEETVLYNRDQQQQVNIKPTDLRTAAVHFKITDGLTPSVKVMETDEFQTVIQTTLQSPALAAGMDIPDMFVYLMKEKGADLRPFLKSPAQQQYEGQMSAWSQAAQMAAQKGVDFNTPMPQPSAQYQSEMAGKQRNPNQPTPETKLPPSPTSQAAESTQGLTPASVGATTQPAQPAGKLGNAAT